MTPKEQPQIREGGERYSAEIYFDEAECYYESPQNNGALQDATETLNSYETEVRLAACAFAEAYANYRAAGQQEPEITDAHRMLDNEGVECGPASAEPRSIPYRLGLLLEKRAGQQEQPRGTLAQVAEKLEADSLAWDEKNDDRPLPSAQGSTDYVYGYNAGVSEGFRAASVRVRAALAAAPPPSEGAK